MALPPMSFTGGAAGPSTSGTTNNFTSGAFQYKSSSMSLATAAVLIAAALLAYFLLK